MVKYCMKKYKLYEYTYTESEPNTTSMKYIVDNNYDIVYYKLNDTNWKRAKSITLVKDDTNLKFIRDLTKEEVESYIFIDIV